MKPIRLFGLATLAALVAMAFTGVGSAMGESTALCKEDKALFNPGYQGTDECPSASRVSHVHETTLAGKKAKLLNPVRLVECDVLFLGDVKSTNNLGAPLVIKGNFTYSNCGECTVLEENGPAEILILREGHETAKVLVGFLIRVACSGFFTCSYDPLEIEGTGKGPLLSRETNGEVELNEQLLPTEEVFFCPEETKLDIVTTPLEKVYLAA